jgi:hypothetical protein
MAQWSQPLPCPARFASGQTNPLPAAHVVADQPQARLAQPAPAQDRQSTRGARGFIGHWGRARQE